MHKRCAFPAKSILSPFYVNKAIVTSFISIESRLRLRHNGTNKNQAAFESRYIQPTRKVKQATHIENRKRGKMLRSLPSPRRPSNFRRHTRRRRRAYLGKHQSAASRPKKHTEITGKRLSFVPCVFNRALSPTINKLGAKISGVACIERERVEKANSATQLKGKEMEAGPRQIKSCFLSHSGLRGCKHTQQRARKSEREKK